MTTEIEENRDYWKARALRAEATITEKAKKLETRVDEVIASVMERLAAIDAALAGEGKP